MQDSNLWLRTLTRFNDVILSMWCENESERFGDSSEVVAGWLGYIAHHVNHHGEASVGFLRCVAASGAAVGKLGGRRRSYAES